MDSCAPLDTTIITMREAANAAINYLVGMPAAHKALLAWALVTGAVIIAAVYISISLGDEFCLFSPEGEEDDDDDDDAPSGLLVSGLLAVAYEAASGHISGFLQTLLDTPLLRLVLLPLLLVICGRAIGCGVMGWYLGDEVGFMPTKMESKRAASATSCGSLAASGNAAADSSTKAPGKGAFQSVQDLLADFDTRDKVVENTLLELQRSLEEDQRTLGDAQTADDEESDEAFYTPAEVSDEEAEPESVNALTWPAEVADEEARPTPAAAVTGLQHSCHAVSEPWTPADYREKPAAAPFLPPRMKPAAPSVPRGKQALNPGAQRWTPPAGPTTATGQGNAISTPAPMPLNVGLAASIHAGPALNPGKAKQQERRKGPAAAPSIPPHRKLAVNPGVKRWVVPASVLEDKQEYMDFKPEPLPTTNGGLAASKHAR